MALKVTRRMPAFDTQTAGQTATARLPIGLTYHQLFVIYAGVTLAQMNEIRIVANGETIQRWATGGGKSGGTRLDEQNQSEGRAAAAGILTIDFDRYNLRVRAMEEATRLGTGLPAQDPAPVTTLTLEIDIDAAAIGTAMTTFAKQSVPDVSGIIKKLRVFNRATGGTGEFEVDDLPKGEVINKIYNQFSAGAVDNLKIEVDNFLAFDRSAALNNKIQTDGVRVPQAGYYIFDPTEDGNGAEGLTTLGVSDLRLIWDQITAAATYVLSVEYLGPLEV